jgi:hypothetical protein
MVEKDFDVVTDFLINGINITAALKPKAGKTVKEFKSYVDAAPQPDIVALKKQVAEFASQFPVPGIDDATMKFK